MSLMEITKPTRLERILSWFARLFFAELEEDSLEQQRRIYPGGMFEEGNRLYRHILHRWVASVRVDETHLEAVQKASETGTLVYVTLNLGQLEYIIFNDLFVEKKLPLAHFNNALRSRRWLPIKNIWESYLARAQGLKARKKFPDPMENGFLEKTLAKGNAILYSLEEWNPEEISFGDRQFFSFLLSLREKSTGPIVLVPVQLIWDKRPRKEKASLFEALFGENERPGRWRKLALFLRHYKKRAVIQMGEPIALETFFTQESASQKLYQKIAQSFRVERRTLTGPVIHPKEWFLEKIFEEEDLGRILYEVAKEKNKPIESVKHLARKYAKEIVADLRYSHIEFTAAILTRVFQHLFEGIVLSAEGIKTLKKTLARGPVVLVPNHRSHLDYLLLGFLCYDNDIVSPYVAAGLNMAFFPMGGFFRRCGAFFLRRSFDGNALYKKIFQTYLKILVREGYLQEFFIEGGRSRTGKLRSPKLGMLSMYSDCMAEGASGDLFFLPVSITYDKVLEQKTYLKEAQGKPKQSERALDILKLTKYLKGRYGKIYVHFGDPVSWQETATEVGETEWEKKKQKLVPLLAHKISHTINQNIVAIPQALTATALLMRPQFGLLVEEAEKNFSRLLRYLQFKQAPLSDPLQKHPTASFQEALNQFESSGLLKRHKGLEQAFFEIPSGKRDEIDFFKNFSIHRFVSLSLFSKLILAHRNGGCQLEKLAREYALFQDFLKFEFRFSTRRPLMDHLETLCHFLKEEKIIDYAGGEIQILREGLNPLKDLSLLIQNYLEAYWASWETFLLKPTQPWNEKELQQTILQHAKDLYLLGKIHYPESISKAIFENAIRALKIFQDTRSLKTILDRLISL